MDIHLPGTSDFILTITTPTGDGVKLSLYSPSPGSFLQRLVITGIPFLQVCVVVCVKMPACVFHVTQACENVATCFCHSLPGDSAETGCGTYLTRVRPGTLFLKCIGLHKILGVILLGADLPVNVIESTNNLHFTPVPGRYFCRIIR